MSDERGMTEIARDFYARYLDFCEANRRREEDLVAQMDRTMERIIAIRYGTEG